MINQLPEELIINVLVHMLLGGTIHDVKNCIIALVTFRDSAYNAQKLLHEVLREVASRHGVSVSCVGGPLNTEIQYRYGVRVLTHIDVRIIPSLVEMLRRFGLILTPMRDQNVGNTTCGYCSSPLGDSDECEWGCNSEVWFVERRGTCCREDERYTFFLRGDIDYVTLGISDTKDVGVYLHNRHLSFGHVENMDEDDPCEEWYKIFA